MSTPIALARVNNGDMLEFERPFGYKHYGVYGGNEEVFHFAPDSPAYPKGAKGRVQRSNYHDVAGGDTVYRNNSMDATLSPRSGEEILRHANASMGETGYNLFTNNCEHKANEWRYGEGSSKQASVGGILTIAGVAAVNLIPIVGPPLAIGGVLVGAWWLCSKLFSSKDKR